MHVSEYLYKFYASETQWKIKCIMQNNFNIKEYSNIFTSIILISFDHLASACNQFDWQVLFGAHHMCETAGTSTNTEDDHM